MAKRLTKSATNVKVFGVCGGIGEYLGVDPLFIRLFAIIATAWSGFVPGIIVYIVIAYVMPSSSTFTRKPHDGAYTEHSYSTVHKWDAVETLDMGHVHRR